MRLYHGCGTVLTIKHTISLVLVSNFDLEDDKVLLTKHKLIESKNIIPHLNLKDCKTFFCNRCGEEVSYPKCLVSCDDCGSFFEQNDVKSIGGLLFCRRCLGKNKNFSDFSIFGEKSKTKKQRDRVIGEAFSILSSEIVPANTVAPPQVSALTQQDIVNTIWNSADLWLTTSGVDNPLFTSSGTRR